MTPVEQPTSARATAAVETSATAFRSGPATEIAGISKIDAASAEGTATIGVAPACGCTDKKSNIFAIGVIGFDFGSDARRDTFRQLMPRITVATSQPPITMAPNPYDPEQLCNYLDKNPSESTKLVWTLNLDLTPIYALEAEVAYAEDVYSVFRSALRNESLPSTDAKYVSRVSVSGVLTARTVRLFSGQVVPVVVVQSRGLFTWNETALVDVVVQAIKNTVSEADTDVVKQTVRNFLDKVYYQLRNLGQTSPDRALNFSATNAFVFAEGVAQGILSGSVVPGPKNLYTLDTISVSKSMYCRMDSDCWDVQITFFDPENDRRARAVYQFTIDVSDTLPVSLAPTRQFLVAG
jgi:cyanobactin maturation PatA/PatG family protease